MHSEHTRSLQKFLVRLVTLDLDEYSKFPAWVLRQVKITYHAAREFVHDRCLLLASSLTYTTILSVVPLMAVSLSWFSRLKLSEEDVQNFLSQYLFPNAVLFQTIQDNIDRFSQNAAALSTVGTIFLFITAYSLINTMEKSLNTIWHVTEKRTLWEKVSSFWLLLTLAPILIGAALFMTARLKSLPGVGTVLEYPLIKASLVYLIPFVMILVAFFLLYKLLPFTRVSTRSALGGALIGTALFLLLKWGFGLYITHVTAYSKIYGALAAIPAFLIYVFLVWIVVLLGGEFSYVLHYPGLYENGAGKTYRARDYRGYLALRFMLEIARRFRSGGEPVRTLELAQRLGLTFEEVEEILLHLKEEGLLRSVEGGRDTFVPARDPATIPVVRVLEAARGRLLEAAPSPEEPEREVIAELFRRGRTAFEENLGAVNLQDLVMEMEKGQRDPDGRIGPVPL